MRRKRALWILVVLAACIHFSIGHAADKFYFGCFDGEQWADTLTDSLKFNIVRSYNSDSSEIEYLAAAGIRAIPANDVNTSPWYWSRDSRYTLWEAEGFPGSNKNLEYDGGTLVDDDSASGGKAMRFTGPGTARVIQTGPTYRQDPGPELAPIRYTADFRLRHSGGGLPETTQVCSLIVVDRGTILKDTTICKGDFGGENSYQSFKLEDYTVPFTFDNRVEFRIHWFAVAGDLYVDYVKVCDDNGDWLMRGEEDQNIIDYVSQNWVDDTLETGQTVIYRWYMRDEPQSIDYYMPYAHIDSLLKEVSQERVGFQAFNLISSAEEVHEYLLREDPEDLFVVMYPMARFGHDTTGENYQNEWSKHADTLGFAKAVADSVNKDLWLAAQAHRTVRADTSGCDWPLIWWNDKYYCPTYRDPTRYELRLQTFLGLCYGIDAIMYYRYSFFINGNENLVMGLYDHESDSTTQKWREIKEFTGPRVDKLAPILQQLTWLGAGFHGDVATVTGSFMDSLKAAPAETLTTTYVEVGFFEDDADTDYFMLVNRQCLENEDESVIVYIDNNAIGEEKMWYVIDQYSQDTTFTGAMNEAIPFTTHLEPGEGKLFKLAPFPDSAFHGTARPLNWQGGIMLDGTFK